MFAMHSALPIYGRLLLVLIALMAASAAARQPEPSRLVRTLIGTSKAAKLRELDKLARRPKLRDAAIADLSQAATIVAEQAAQQDSSWLPTGTLALYDLLGSSAEPAATEALIQLLRFEHTKIAMASAEALGRYNRTSAFVALKAQTNSPDYASSYAFRFSLLKSIAQLRSPETVEFLTATLPTLEGQLKHEVATFLGKITASHFHGDQQQFDAWRTNTWEPLLASGFSEALPGTARSYRTEKYEPPTYYGMPIYARRLIFVVDRSPSMDKIVDGQSRLRRAILELSQAINALDPATEFTVVFFDGRVRAWRKELVEASPKNKRSVIKFARQLYRSNLTNTYGALRTALKIDDNTEAIYLISDGEPTSGTIREPSEIVADITNRNSFRYIAINTIGVALMGRAQRFMQELAEQNGGEYRDTE